MTTYRLKDSVIFDGENDIIITKDPLVLGFVDDWQKYSMWILNGSSFWSPIITGTKEQIPTLTSGVSAFIEYPQGFPKFFGSAWLTTKLEKYRIFKFYAMTKILWRWFFPKKQKAYRNDYEDEEEE